MQHACAGGLLSSQHVSTECRQHSRHVCVLTCMCMGNCCVCWALARLQDRTHACARCPRNVILHAHSLSRHCHAHPSACMLSCNSCSAPEDAPAAPTRTPVLSEYGAAAGAVQATQASPSRNDVTAGPTCNSSSAARISGQPATFSTMDDMYDSTDAEAMCRHGQRRASSPRFVPAPTASSSSPQHNDIQGRLFTAGSARRASSPACQQPRSGSACCEIGSPVACGGSPLLQAHPGSADNWHASEKPNFTWSRQHAKAVSAEAAAAGGGGASVRSPSRSSASPGPAVMNLGAGSTSSQLARVGSNGSTATSVGPKSGKPRTQVR